MSGQPTSHEKAIVFHYHQSSEEGPHWVRWAQGCLLQGGLSTKRSQLLWKSQGHGRASPGSPEESGNQGAVCASLQGGQVATEKVPHLGVIRS